MANTHPSPRAHARLRDELAMVALPLVVKSAIASGRSIQPTETAALSYEIADAMLSARALPHPHQDGEA